MKTYIYVGIGDGIPGMPHEITDEQAKADGLTPALLEAVKNGSYVEKKAVTEKPAAKKELTDG